MILLTWSFWMLLTFTNGNQDRQTYHFPVVVNVSPTMTPEMVAVAQQMASAAAEAQCNKRYEERKAWLELQHRDGLIKGSAVVVCHEEQS